MTLYVKSSRFCCQETSHSVINKPSVVVSQNSQPYAIVYKEAYTEPVMTARSLVELDALKITPLELPPYSLHTRSLHSCKRAAKLVTKGAENSMRLGKQGWVYIQTKFAIEN